MDLDFLLLNQSTWVKMHHDFGSVCLPFGRSPPKKNDKPDKQLVDVQPMEASNRPRKEHTPGTQNTNMIQDFHN